MSDLPINPDERPSWDAYFMEIAHVAAKRSTCLRRRVGAVLVRGKHPISTGYNGTPSGLRHCGHLGGCLRQQLNVPSGERHELCRGLHAEQNAVIQAAKHGVSTEESTLYCTTYCCSICVKILINAGVRRIVFDGAYPDGLAETMLAEAGITCERLEGETLYHRRYAWLRWRQLDPTRIKELVTSCGGGEQEAVLGPVHTARSKPLPDGRVISATALAAVAGEHAGELLLPLRVEIIAGSAAAADELLDATGLKLPPGSELTTLPAPARAGTTRSAELRPERL